MKACLQAGMFIAMCTDNPLPNAALLPSLTTCMAFTTSGSLKSAVPSMDKFTKLSGDPCRGLYVRSNILGKLVAGCLLCLPIAPLPLGWPKKQACCFPINHGSFHPSPSAVCPHAKPAGYTFVAGRNSLANDLVSDDVAATRRGNIPALAQACNAITDCAGFNTGGYLKKWIRPASAMYSLPGSIVWPNCNGRCNGRTGMPAGCEGLYIRTSRLCGSVAGYCASGRCCGGKACCLDGQKCCSGNCLVGTSCPRAPPPPIKRPPPPPPGKQPPSEYAPVNEQSKLFHLSVCGVVYRRAACHELYPGQGLVTVLRLARLGREHCCIPKLSIIDPSPDLLPCSGLQNGM